MTFLHECKQKMVWYSMNDQLIDSDFASYKKYNEPRKGVPMSDLSGMEWLTPIWHTPHIVRSLITTRLNGVSNGAYTSLNLGTHVGDDPQKVAGNRALVAQNAQVRPVWLNQVHGNRVVFLDERSTDNIEADAAITSIPGIACTVMLRLSAGAAV